MPYEIQFKSSAWKAFNKLEGEARGRIAEAVMSLAENPRPRKARKLSGKGDFYRIRSGDYRVIYEVREKALVVLIVKVGHRREVYKKL
jgi:mRNA interferase RelE/StbE